MSSSADYYARFRRVLDHVDAHLDEDLPLERLSAVAAFSKYHFHRQFSELYGLGVYKYVQLVRFRRASYQLAFRSQLAIIDVALASGYESHEAFARAFKKAIGQSPSEFRAEPEWAPWHAVYERMRALRSLHMKPEHRIESVEIVHFPETHVAALRHRGHPDQIESSVRKFIAWRKQNKLPPKLSATFNICHDDPSETEPEDYRLDLCAATDRGVDENPEGVVEATIPGGRCALLRHVGSEDTLGDAVRFLYATWLPASGEELRDFPLYLQRVRFFPDVAEHEAVTDIFLPLA